MPLKGVFELHVCSALSSSLLIVSLSVAVLGLGQGLNSELFVYRR